MISILNVSVLFIYRKIQKYTALMCNVVVLQFTDPYTFSSEFIYSLIYTNIHVLFTSHTLIRISVDIVFVIINGYCLVFIGDQRNL